MRTLGALFSAFCTATVLALLIGLGYLVAAAEEALKKRQSEWEGDERAKGIDEAVLLMSKLSPSQAKELILLRLKQNDMDWVVVLMRKLPADRQAKIAAEFTTAEETQKLD